MLVVQSKWRAFLTVLSKLLSWLNETRQLEKVICLFSLVLLFVEGDREIC